MFLFLLFILAQGALAASPHAPILVVSLGPASPSLGVALVAVYDFYLAEAGVRLDVATKTVKYKCPRKPIDPLSLVFTIGRKAKRPYGSTMLMIVPPCFHAPFAGSAEQGGVNAYVSWSAGDPTREIAHELGHLFGLRHSSFNGNPLGDQTSVMGGAASTAVAHLTSYERSILGVPIATCGAPPCRNSTYFYESDGRVYRLSDRLV